MNRKDESEENVSWAKKVLKNMEITNMLIAPSVRTAQSAEIKDEKAFSCVLSNFNCDESKMDLKSFFVKQCLEVPGIQLQISKEDITYIRKIDGKGRFLIRFKCTTKRNELFSKRFLIGKNKKIYLDLDLTFLQREQVRNTLHQLNELNKSRIAEGKNIIRGFQCGKNVKLNGFDFIITKNLEKFISESFEWMAPVLT